MTNEEQLLNNESERAKLLDRVNVLDKVKDIVTMPNTDVYSMQQVADYFEVPLDTVKKTCGRNVTELKSNGVTVLRADDLKAFKHKTGHRTQAATFTVFTKRAVLNIAMLLRDSVIAKEIRRQLLDFIEDHIEVVEESIVTAIEKEKALAVDVIFAQTEEERLLAMSAYRKFKQDEIDRLTERVEVAEDIVENLVKSENHFGIREARTNLGVPEQKFVKWLISKKMVYRNASGTLKPYSEYTKGDTAYFSVVFSHKSQVTGKAYAQTVITGLGMTYFRKHLEEIKKYCKIK